MNFISRNKRLLSILLSIIILLLILFKLKNDDTIAERIQTTWKLLTSSSPILLLLILILSPLNWLTETYKWQFLLSKIQKINLWKAMGSVLSGMSFALVSPGKVGDFAGRLLYLDEGVRWRAFFMSMISSLSHFIVTCIMGAVGLIFLCIYYPDWLFITLLVAAFLISIVGLILFLHVNRLKSKPNQYKSKWIRKFFISVQVVRRYNQRDLVKVLLITLLKFILYNTQFIIASHLLGADIGFISTFLASCVMFWLIMIIPSFFMADVIIRGMIATLIFERTGLVQDTLPFISASYIIWLINWVLPASIGGLVFFTRNVFKVNEG